MEDLHYNFTCMAAPVQAEGIICDRPFYFRARHESWSFAVSENPEIDPTEIESLEQGSACGFFVEQQYGDESFAASYMPLDEAAKIIERCAEKYLRARIKRKI